MELEQHSPPSPEEQKASVRSLLKGNNEKNMKVGDSFFLISAKWWNDWKEYVQWDESNDAEDVDNNGERVIKSPRSSAVDIPDVPSAIDNDDLWEENEMKPGLMEGENYIIVDGKCWNLLSSWYVSALWSVLSYSSDSWEGMEDNLLSRGKLLPSVLTTLCKLKYMA
jgi:hypothetical protein